MDTAICGELIDSAATTFQLGIDVRLRNQSVRSRRKALGLTQKQLADAIGVSKHTIQGIEVLRQRPSSETRSKLAQVLKCTPHDIWPDWLDEIEKSNITLEADLDAVQFSQLRGAQLNLVAPPLPDNEGAQRIVNAALATLPYRQREILKMRFGLDGDRFTYDEIGHIFKITRERARQIEAKALRTLEESDLKQKLKEAIC